MKLFLVTDNMDIGGAETHIWELSRLLCARGHRVTVLSAGGRLAAALPRVGVRHIKLPSLTDPVTFPRALSALAGHIRRHKPDIVHAHTRRSAFLCRLLLLSFDFPFVVTAHAMFRSQFPYNRLSVFPPATIAVSNDIRNTLIRDFSVPGEHITVIENGIDTRRFSPRPSKKHPLTVLTVSRLDRDCSYAARLLIGLTPHLARKLRQPVRLMIAGGGESFSELSSLANDVNDALGYRAITLPGNRTDVHRLLDECDIFVGVSRAALEAMAAAKPVILCGDEGYLGILDKDTFPKARQSNFCARGNSKATAKQLLGDLLHLAALSPAARNALGASCREIVCQKYDAYTMAKKTEAIYCRELNRFQDSRRSNALICGYYGYGNGGDELILKSIVSHQKTLSPHLRISVLTGRNGIHEGARSVYRYAPPSLIKEMRGSGAFILGGGSLLQDTTSYRSLLYYLSLLALAHRMALPTMVYANGLGPLSDRSLLLCRRLLSFADVISLRDRESYETVLAMKLPHTRVILSADPVLADPPRTVLPTGTPPYMAIFPRGNGTFAKASAADGMILRLAAKYGLDIVVSPMNAEEDGEAVRQFTERLRQSKGIRRVTVGSSDPEAVQTVIGRAALVIGERLHSLILAFRAGVPAVGVDLDPKIAAFFRDVDLTPCTVSPGNLSFGALSCAVDFALAHPPKAKTLSTLRARALRDVYIANSLMLRK